MASETNETREKSLNFLEEIIEESIAGDLDAPREVDGAVWGPEQERKIRGWRKDEMRSAINRWPASRRSVGRTVLHPGMTRNCAHAGSAHVACHSYARTYWPGACRRSASSSPTRPAASTPDPPVRRRARPIPRACWMR